MTETRVADPDFGRRALRRARKWDLWSDPVVVAWRRPYGAKDAESMNGADPNLLYGAYVSDDAE